MKGKYKVGEAESRGLVKRLVVVEAQIMEAWADVGTTETEEKR